METKLGRASAIPNSPEDATLDPVPNPHPDDLYVARFTCPEFTSLCPVTGAPDFAHIVIDYVPKNMLLESKSLKLFLFAFRNHGAFHEDCTVTIAKSIVAAVNPVCLRISAYWYPRGGIPIDVFYTIGELPSSLTWPETGVPTYRGRG